MKKTDRPEYCPENYFNLSIPAEPLVVLETFGHALGCIPGLTSIGILPGLPQFFFSEKWLLGMHVKPVQPPPLAFGLSVAVVLPIPGFGVPPCM